jgi:hypothetical protein
MFWNALIRRGLDHLQNSACRRYASLSLFRILCRPSRGRQTHHQNHLKKTSHLFFGLSASDSRADSADL